MIVDHFWAKGLKGLFGEMYPHIIRVPYPLGVKWQPAMTYRVDPFIEKLATGVKDEDGTFVLQSDTVRAPYDLTIVFHNKIERAILVCLKLPGDEFLAEVWIMMLITENEYGMLNPFVFRGGLLRNGCLTFLLMDDWKARFLDDSAYAMACMYDEHQAQHWRETLTDVKLKMWKTSKLQDNEFLPHIPFDMGKTLFLTFKLLATKNIVTYEQFPEPKLQAKRKKANKLPLFSWHELAMQGVAVTKRMSGNLTHQLQPIHWVRGHFKEYTPDKPLFGHIVGRYWWQPHLAGKDTTRFVEKTYVVERQPNHEATP